MLKLIYQIVSYVSLSLLYDPFHCYICFFLYPNQLSLCCYLGGRVYVTFTFLLFNYLMLIWDLIDSGYAFK